MDQIKFKEKFIELIFIFNNPIKILLESGIIRIISQALDESLTQHSKMQDWFREKLIEIKKLHDVAYVPNKTKFEQSSSEILKLFCIAMAYANNLNSPLSIAAMVKNAQLIAKENFLHFFTNERLTDDIFWEKEVRSFYATVVYSSEESSPKAERKALNHHEVLDYLFSESQDKVPLSLNIAIKTFIEVLPVADPLRINKGLDRLMDLLNCDPEISVSTESYLESYLNNPNLRKHINPSIAQSLWKILNLSSLPENVKQALFRTAPEIFSHCSAEVTTPVPRPAAATSALLENGRWNPNAFFGNPDLVNPSTQLQPVCVSEMSLSTPVAEAPLSEGGRKWNPQEFFSYAHLINPQAEVVLGSSLKLSSTSGQ